MKQVYIKGGSFDTIPTYCPSYTFIYLYITMDDENDITFRIIKIKNNDIPH